MNNIYESNEKRISPDKLAQVQATAQRAVVRALGSLEAQAAPKDTIRLVTEAEALVKPGSFPGYGTLDTACDGLVDVAVGYAGGYVAQVIEALSAVYAAHVDASRCEHCGCVGGH